MSWFDKSDRGVVAWRVVELHDKPLPVIEDEEAIRRLKDDPGFKMLMNRLRVQKAVVDTALRKGKHDDIRQVDNLQQATFWMEWLEDQVNKAVAKKKEVHYAEPTPSQAEQFDQVFALIQDANPATSG